MSYPFLSKTFVEKQGQTEHVTASEKKPRRIIAISGGKGGVGKTIITAIIGVALAEMNKKTIVLDLDFGGANLHQILGIPSPPRSLGDFIKHSNTVLQELCLETTVPNLSLIAGATGSLIASQLQFWMKQKVVRHIKNIEAEHIILDIGAGNSFNQLDYFNFADEGIIVATPEPLSIQDAYNFVKMALFRKVYRMFYNKDSLSANITVRVPIMAPSASRIYFKSSESMEQFMGHNLMSLSKLSVPISFLICWKPVMTIKKAMPSRLL